MNTTTRHENKRTLYEDRKSNEHHTKTRDQTSHKKLIYAKIAYLD
jgi:hypothetical protein